MLSKALPSAFATAEKPTFRDLAQERHLSRALVSRQTSGGIYILCTFGRAAPSLRYRVMIGRFGSPASLTPLCGDPRRLAKRGELQAGRYNPRLKAAAGQLQRPHSEQILRYLPAEPMCPLKNSRDRYCRPCLAPLLRQGPD